MQKPREQLLAVVIGVISLAGVVAVGLWLSGGPVPQYAAPALTPAGQANNVRASSDATTDDPDDAAVKARRRAEAARRLKPVVIDQSPARPVAVAPVRLGDAGGITADVTPMPAGRGRSSTPAIAPIRIEVPRPPAARQPIAPVVIAPVVIAPATPAAPAVPGPAAAPAPAAVASAPSHSTIEPVTIGVTPPRAAVAPAITNAAAPPAAVRPAVAPAPATGPANVQLATIRQLPPSNEDLLGPPELRDKLKFVMSMCQDLDGNIWFATEDNGIFRWSGGNDRDPKRWTQFTTKDGLGDDNTYAIACDHKNRVWAGHLNHGVSVYNGEKWQNYEVVGGLSRPDSLNGPLGERVFRIAVCPTDGDVWMATSLGLSRYSDTKGWMYYTRADGLPSDQANGIAFNTAGDIFVATQCDGLAIAQAGDNYKTWRQVVGPDREPAQASGGGLPTNLLNDVALGPDGTIWLATHSGVAWSADAAKTWQFLRGAEWLDKVHAATSSQPAAVAVAQPSVTPLSEDDCTCLCATGRGAMLVGHRSAWGEGVGSTANITHGVAVAPDANAAMVIGGTVLVGTDGEEAFHDGALPPAARVEKHATCALPIAAAAPTNAQMAAAVAMPATPPPGSPIPRYAGEDWRTQGDWVGRYGRQHAILFAANWPEDEQVNHGNIFYVVHSSIGPNHPKRDVLRRWMCDAHASSQSALYDPYVGRRVDAYIDDHGEVYDRHLDGPDIHLGITLPAGTHRIALYFNNGKRDFLVELRAKKPAAAGGGSSPVARARVVFARGGVYKSFIASGPGEYEFVVHRNWSHNTNCNALMIDRLSGPATYVDRWGLAEMGEQEYAPPDIAADSETVRADPGTAHSTLPSVPLLPDSLAAFDVLPQHILAYRALVARGAPPATLENYRWYLRLWQNPDRAKFHSTMALAFKSEQAETVTVWPTHK